MAYSFTEAVELLKQGYRVRHKEWDTGVYLFRVFGRIVRSSIDERYGEQCGNPECEVYDAIYIRTSKGNLAPWLPSHIDLLSDSGWAMYD